MPEISGGWNWEPYIRSLIEGELKYPQNKNIFHGPPCGSDSFDDGDSDVESQCTGHSGLAPPRNLPPGQAGGSWDYLLYVPAWSDREFPSDLRPVYGKQPQKYERLPPWNLLTRLRPALRADDAVRNPTPHAMRWGIFPGRQDGRSRMSPPYSDSRGYNMGINDSYLRTLENTGRTMLLQETRARMQLGTTTYRGEGVAPELLDEARRRSNVPGHEDLIQGTVRSDGVFALSVRNHLPAGFDVEPYNSMISDILEDEDYQRLVMGDFTTDELIRHGVHDMSSSGRYSLTHEPLHE